MTEQSLQVKNKISEIEIIDNDARIKSQNFQKRLHLEPDKNSIKENQFAGNSKYIPISFLEMQLDEYFFGLWSIENFTYMTVANEVVGSLELKVFHPVHKVWITRVGAGAVQIQMRSEKKGGSGDITNIRDKIVNTLTKDFPHLKAECFRNACKSIGKLFGRDLNREFEDQYNPLIKDDSDSIESKQKAIIYALSKYTGTDKEALREICKQKKDSGEFDLKFANEIADKIGLKL